MSTINKSLISKSYKSLAGLSMPHLSSIYGVVDDIISLLDDRALNEILTNSDVGIDTFFTSLIGETANALYGSNERVSISSFGYYDHLYKKFNFELECLSLAYFTTNCVPGFTVEPYHLEWFNMIQLYNKICVIAARDHSKSFVFSYVYPMWRLYRYHKPDASIRLSKHSRNADMFLYQKGMMITNEFSLGKMFLSFIRDEIEDNDILKERLFPDNHRETWGKEEIKTKNGAGLVVKSFNSKMRGHHPQYIIGDDLLTDASLYSAEQRNKYKDSFYSVIMNLIPGYGHAAVVGTPFHNEDLYADLKKKWPIWRVFEYPAIFPDGKTLSTRWKFSELMEKRVTQGPINFSREILIKPVTSASSIFPYTLVKKSFVGMHDYRLTENRTAFGKKFPFVVTGCDLAISANVGADYSVFTTWGIDELDNMWLLNMWRASGSHYSEQVAQLRRINTNFQPDLFVIETNQFQKVIAQMAQEANLPVQQHNTGVGKHDLYSGLPGVAILFDQHKIKLPRGDDHSRNVTDTLVSEFTSVTWTGKGKLESADEHDDIAMSTWLATIGRRSLVSSFGMGML